MGPAERGCMRRGRRRGGVSPPNRRRDGRPPRRQSADADRLSISRKGRLDVPFVQRFQTARRRLRQPDRRFADVPVLVGGRFRQRLAFRPSFCARCRRRGPRVHRGGGGDGRGADLAAGSRRLERETLRAARADRALRQGARRRARRSARPCRAEGELHRPWSGQGSVPEARGGWRAVAPSPIAFGGDTLCRRS